MSNVTKRSVAEEGAGKLVLCEVGALRVLVSPVVVYTIILLGYVKNLEHNVVISIEG